jgi:hypothetical protein
MISAECVTETSVSKITVCENRKSATINNHERVVHRRVQVDGCVINDRETLCADWVIERDALSVVIELKGRDVEHAAKQVIATSELWKSERRYEKICGLIVARQYPRSSSSIQLKQQQYSRRFSGPLHIVTGNYAFDIENLLSFRGPHRR